MYKVETREALAFVSMPVDFDKVLSIFLRISIMEKLGQILSNASIVGHEWKIENQKYNKNYFFIQHLKWIFFSFVQRKNLDEQ